MPQDGVAGVRRFNRTVTQRVGALHDEYLSRERSLGSARLLWEIGPDATSLTSLRARLDLDSGYLSRLLRGLEDDGLVVVRSGKADGRERTAHLTAAGRKEWSALDDASDELALSILNPLSRSQQQRLLSAMDEVQQLLMASMVHIDALPPTHPDARFCIRSYFDELRTRFEGGFDPGTSISAGDDELSPPAGVLLVARIHGEPIGCGALKFREEHTADLKRMWISPSVRGLGVGRRLLSELECHAIDRGIEQLRLETNRALVEAINLYRTSGYNEVPPFNNEPYADHWFEKPLTPAARSSRHDSRKDAASGTAKVASGGGRHAAKDS
jgi:DNA-binding MarR family transcriptional regulator/GNAT superfamily N-acetyltransferase